MKFSVSTRYCHRLHRLFEGQGWKKGHFSTRFGSQEGTLVGFSTTGTWGGATGPSCTSLSITDVMRNFAQIEEENNMQKKFR